MGRFINELGLRPLAIAKDADVRAFVYLTIVVDHIGTDEPFAYIGSASGHPITTRRRYFGSNVEIRALFMRAMRRHERFPTMFRFVVWVDEGADPAMRFVIEAGLLRTLNAYTDRRFYNVKNEEAIQEQVRRMQAWRQTDAARVATSAGMKRAWQDPAKRDRMVAGTRRVRDKRSLRVRQAWANPENKARLRAAMKRVAARPEVRERMLKQLRSTEARRHAAETRAKMSTSHRLRNARRRVALVPANQRRLFDD